MAHFIIRPKKKNYLCLGLHRKIVQVGSVGKSFFLFLFFYIFSHIRRVTFGNGDSFGYQNGLKILLLSIMKNAEENF